ncbi:efflux RND transporter periplasmic adaptor subunit [Pyxidicoccus sp. MSG2]|uniref:efflux RND transporter periplasmic adaptor subunit n=1 Tax=Pyxidicoccus sp. MSG2 TaxID=2996790 RepID=UPI00226DB853|nr:efflux RND transporter periplasmic adaptor subunit [Pyxidicoccus sp. MSG2]MCY1014604.1 efflux RND transporter periplasmic adaptor subunit [Pyxidicoccus sp. MSG2]
MRAPATSHSDVAPPTSTRPTSSRKRWVVGVLLLLGVVAVLVGIKAAQIGAMIDAGATFVPPPEAVTSAKVEAVEWQAARNAVGSVLAIQGVTLGAELSGIVREIGFENGSTVKKGQVLLRLDTTSESAQLTGAEADAELARLTLARVQGLHAQGANTQSELESARARSLQAEAAAANLRAIIAKKVIRAPFDGRIGIRQVELGQVVSPGNPIASLHSVDPVYVEFLLPQQALSDARPGQKVRVRVDVFPQDTWEGGLTTINPEVEVSTRNVRMRATVPNPDGRLLPGMFANVEVLAEGKKSVVAMPTTAVLFAPYGDSVFVIVDGKDAAGKPSPVAQQRFVRLGERRGDFVEVTSGLTPGELVANNGAFKLRNGATVLVNDALAPKPEVAPQPVDR